MILYCDTVNNFINGCSGTNPIIGKQILDKFLQNGLGNRTSSEYNSWINSLPRVAEALNDDSIPKDAYVGVEYKLIDTKQRVDFLIYGKDDKDIENVVIVELKQWSSVKKSNLKNYVVTNGGHGDDDYWHPSYQAYNYANIMKSFNEYVYSNNVEVNACSYLHNMDDGYDGIINDKNSYPLIIQAPAFLKNDTAKLTQFISRYVKKSYKQTLYQIDGSRIRPSAGFSKMVADSIKGTPFFSYDAEQAYSVSRIVSEVKNSLDNNEKAVLIVKGGPGSGKSIVAINALGQLLNPHDGSPRRNACYLTANFTPRTYFGDVLTGSDFTKKAIKELFKTPAAFAKSSKNDFDCVIVDEAHRMLKWKFGWGIQRNIDIIDKLFNASRVLVFLIDEDQVVTASDDLSIAQIYEYANKHGCKIIEDDRMILSSQFRCVGGEEYIEFVKKALGYQNQFNTLKGIKYEVKVMDSMTDMIKELRKKNNSNHAMRLMAGYTHEWVSENDTSLYDFEYDNGNVKLQWNIKKSNRVAILDENQKENVFCIHTIQGLEVEYAGVIIGKDLTYNPNTNKLEFHKENNAKTDTASGIRKADDALAERLIRNTYKVLLTRGVKGTYIFAEDPNLNEYLKKLLKY